MTDPRPVSAGRAGSAVGAGTLALALLTALPASATTITAYDGLGAAEQGTLVESALADIAARHAGAGACIDAYAAPAAGGAAPRLEADFQSVLARSREVAPDDMQVENLLEGLIMVECHIAPE